MRSQTTLALLVHVGVFGCAAAISVQGPPKPAAANVQTSSGFSVAAATKTVEARAREPAETRPNGLAQTGADEEMEEELQAVIALADSNKDGKLSWDEVVSHAKLERQKEVITATQKGEPAELIKELQWDQKSENDLKAAFDISDKNKDGSLSREELPAMLEEEDEEGERDDEEKRRKGGDGEQMEEEQEEQEEEEQEKEPANDAREDEVSVSLLEVEEAPAEDSNDKLDSVQAADVTEELQSFEEQADTNKDGKLSLDEVKVFFKSHVGSDLARKFHISMVDLTAEFEAADSNKDGFLEHQELMDLDLEPESGDDTKEGDDKDTQQKDGDSQASLVEVSKSAPTNKDKGHHKTKKAKAALSDFAASTSELKDTFDHIDTDKDGRISWLDFKAGLRLARTEKKIPADMDIATVKSDFKQADGDKDGYIGFKDFVDLAKAEFRRWGDSAGDMLGSLLSLKAA